MKKIGIVGSRRRATVRDFVACIKKFEELYEKGDIIVSGGCYKGGDKFAEILALVLVMQGKELEEIDPPIPLKNWLLALTQSSRRELIEKYNAPIIIYDADWENRGRIAGFERNTIIAEEVDELIALVTSDRTGGTEDTIKKFERRGKKAILI